MTSPLHYQDKQMVGTVTCDPQRAAENTVAPCVIDQLWLGISVRDQRTAV